MNVVFSVAEMQEIARRYRRAGETTALVPTMGALHEGHLALVKEAARNASRVLVSIFVNPTQFGPSEDLARYPRDLDGDLRRLSHLKVDHVFVPSASDMYPAGFQTRVGLEHLPRHLCGLSRDGHFDGVALVVLKLFNICQPDSAVFGMKDYQQVRVIEKLVEDLALPIRIVRHATVREADGLALSSRNAYLTPEERIQAPVLQSTLKGMADGIRTGQRDVQALLAVGRAALTASGFEVEYLAACDPATLDDVAVVSGAVLLAVAAKLGKTRLIDNLLVPVE